MKELFFNLALFVMLSIAISSFSGCSSGPGVSESNANSSSSGSVGNSMSKDGYPKLVTGLADATLQKIDGTNFKISDLKGKVLLLNIWGTWCGPCRAEVPHLVAMKKKYGDQGFEVLGLNIGDNSGQPETNEQINAFAEQMKINYTIARIPGSALAQFYSITKQSVVPQTMLVDREGYVRGIFIGGGQNIVDSMNRNLDTVMSQ